MRDKHLKILPFDPLVYLDIVTLEVKSITVGSGGFRYIHKIYKTSVALIRSLM